MMTDQVPTRPQIQLSVNGQTMSARSPCTVADLLGQLERPATGLAVEVNEMIIPRDEHDQFELKSGDLIEVVSLVGGG